MSDPKIQFPSPHQAHQIRETVDHGHGLRINFIEDHQLHHSTWRFFVCDKRIKSSRNMSKNTRTKGSMRGQNMMNWKIKLRTTKQQ